MDKASEFNLSIARGCLQASAYVYQHDCAIASDLAHGALLDSPENQVLAFRGTACLRDWMTDVLVKRTSLMDGMKVHTGFWEAFISVMDQVLAAGKRASKPLFITGHSLGGAMAVLAARAIVRNGWQVAGVYTFGGPRIGNAAFARSYDMLLGRQTFRIIDEEDIVGRLPSWVFGWRHVGQEIFLPSIGHDYLVNPSIVHKLISDVWGTVRHWKLDHEVAQVRDHSCEAYQKRLAEVQFVQEVSA